MSISKPFVFLDIDGVLNNPGSYIGLDEHQHPIEGEMVRQLSFLVDTVDAEIVISSTWRYEFSVEDFRAILGAKGLEKPERVVAMTQRFFGDVMRRGEEIKRFLLVRHGRRFETPPFVILDDMGVEEFGNLRHKLVKIDGAVGLTDGDVHMAFRLLARQGLMGLPIPYEQH